MLHLEPPLAFTDHVHLTQPGYQRWGSGLVDELMVGYAAWKGVAATGAGSGSGRSAGAGPLTGTGTGTAAAALH
jgi:hypothetical protein